MMLHFPYHREEISLRVPDDAIVYRSGYPRAAARADALVLDAVERPLGAEALGAALARRRKGEVVIVVSDVTRPIAYTAFLPQLLRRIEDAGVPRDDLTILVATGMHRPSTAAEHIEMFGRDVPAMYRIVNHHSDCEAELAGLPGRSWSGSRVRLNKRFLAAGFRMITGLVEPHIFAGFSGGRKAVCPGLSSFDTLERFHGYEFIADPCATNGVLEGNPLHRESLSIARMAGVDFSLNVVQDKDRHVAAAFAGGLEEAHLAACAFVARHACPPVVREADVVVSSCGGYPLDATFYQCVKGFTSCLPAVRRGGKVIAFGGCVEGIGSSVYAETMFAYVGRWRAFLDHIRQPGVFIKDQWEFQMHSRALEKAGENHVRFVTGGIAPETLHRLSVNATYAPDDPTAALQRLVDACVARGRTIAAVPEGPYCTPV